MLSRPSVSISGCSGDGRGSRRDDAGDWAPRHNSWLLTRERGGCVLVPRTRGETALSSHNTDIDIHNIRRRLLAPSQGSIVVNIDLCGQAFM